MVRLSFYHSSPELGSPQGVFHNPGVSYVTDYLFDKICALVHKADRGGLKLTPFFDSDKAQFKMSYIIYEFAQR